MSNGKHYVIPPAPQAALAVAGSSDLFPVRRIWCVGRNYLEHIKEMGQDEREPPFFFAKPADAIVPDGGTSPYPSLTKDMHHEVELVVALKSGGRNIPVDKALDCVWGYGVGIDLTRRDLQIASRDIKRPWEVGKAFDASAPCGPLKSASQTGHPSKGKRIKMGRLHSMVVARTRAHRWRFMGLGATQLNGLAKPEWGSLASASGGKARQRGIPSPL